MSFKPPTAATEDPVENFMWACKTGDLNGVKKFVEQVVSIRDRQAACSHCSSAGQVASVFHIR